MKDCFTISSLNVNFEIMILCFAFQIPYNTFGLVNICDPQKEIVVEERVLLFYKYDNIPGKQIKNLFDEN